MTVSNRLTIAGALCACLLAANPTPATAQSHTASAPDPAVWGLYTQLAGSSRQATEGYTIRWHWSEPGRELIEDYIAPVTGKLRATDKITVGPTPGTLHFTSSALGGKEWNGTLQPDGSVVYVGTGLLKFHFKAVLAPDGAYEVLPIKLRDGVVVSVAEPNASNRYLLVEAPAQAAVAPVEVKPTADIAPVVAAETRPAPAPATAAQVLDAAQDASAGAVASTAPTARSAAPTSSVVASDAHAGKGKTPTKAATSKAIAERLKTTRDFVNHWIAGQDAVGGVWMRTTDSDTSALSEWARTETGYHIDSRFVDKDGNTHKSVRDWKMEPDGTFTAYVDGAPRLIGQVVALGDGAYRVETLPGLGITPEEAQSDNATYRFNGHALEISDRTGSDAWQATSLDAALASESRVANAIRSAIAAKAAEAAEQGRLEEERHQQYIADTLHAAGYLTDEEAAAQDDSDVEAEAAAKRAAWDAMASANEQALADSLQNLNDTVADIEAQQRAAERARELQQEADDSARRQAEVENARRATERQEAMARQYEAQRQADEARRAALEVSSTLSGASTPAPARPPASSASPNASEHLMGFLGATCEEATQSAHRHFGEGSTFRVAHSRPDGSLCLIQVDMDSVIRGASGTASSQ